MTLPLQKAAYYPRSAYHTIKYLTHGVDTIGPSSYGGWVNGLKKVKTYFCGCLFGEVCTPTEQVPALIFNVVASFKKNLSFKSFSYNIYLLFSPISV